MLIVTIDSVPGKEVKEAYGMVKGTIVKAKNIGRDLGAGFKGIVGGELKGYTDLQDEARKAAMERMVEDAKRLNPKVNAIVGVRMISSTITQGASEITVYGTAVYYE